MLDTFNPPTRIIEAMRCIGLFASLVFSASLSAQQAIQLPPPQAAAAPAADTFRFVSDGPTGPGWSRPDEIARKYFHENLPALFERTLTLNGDIPQRATLRWIFTGPRAGFTIEEIFGLTKIDRWFLVQIKEIVDFEEELATAKN